MGIFSRLFNRGEDGDSPDEADPENASAKKPEAEQSQQLAKPDSIPSVVPESVEPDPPTVPKQASKRPSRRAPPPPRKRKNSKAPPAKAPAAKPSVAKTSPEKAPVSKSSADKASKPPRRSKKSESLPPLELTDSVFPPKPEGAGAEAISDVKIPPPPAPPTTAEFETELLAGWEMPESEPMRPPSTRQKPPSGPPSDDDPLGDIASELDARFDASRRRSSMPIASSRSDRPDGVTTADDLGTIRQLFSEMAVPFMSQVRDFMLELKHTDASTSWIDLCEPALQSLRQTCDQLDMPELATSLDEYVELLAIAKTAANGRVDGEMRHRLLACYKHMTELLPEAFEVGTGREPVIVQLLLLQVPGVHKRTIDKLYRAGVHHFDAFLHGKPDELSAVAGIELELAERIVDKFRDYRMRVHSVVTQFMPGEEHDNLSRLVAQLKEQEQAFESARSGWSDEAVAEKRRLRRERALTQKEIFVALARLGEVQRIDALEKLPVQRQIERLEHFLKSTEKS